MQKKMERNWVDVYVWLCLVKGESVGAAFLPTGTAIGSFALDDVTFVAEGTGHANDFVWVVFGFHFLCGLRFLGLGVTRL